MELTETTQGAVLVVKAVGPLAGDAAAAALRDRVHARAEGSMGRVVLDLSEVPFLDSKGIESLLDAADSLHALGLSMRLCGTREAVREALRVTGTDDTFEFHDDAQAGVRSYL